MPAPYQPAPYQGGAPSVASLQSGPVVPWYKKKRFVIPAVVVALFFILPTLGGGDRTAQTAKSSASASASATASSGPSRSEGNARIGSPASSDATSIIVTKVQIKQTLTNRFYGDKAGTWVLVDVTVTNNGANAATITQSDFTLIAHDGSEYETDSDSHRYLDNEFFLENLNPKMTIKGQVLFAVPSDFAVDQSTLEFRESLFTSPARIDLTP